jgi:hypothetical protein
MLTKSQWCRSLDFNNINKIYSIVFINQYSRIGDPISLMRAIEHLRSKAFANTILNIFCTLMECEVEQKTNGALIAFANLLAYL